MTTGIYKIGFKGTNNFYIGSSANIETRFKQHKYQLFYEKHDNPILQRAYNKYTLDNIYCEIIEICSKLDQFNREQYYLDTLNPIYNINRKADSPAIPALLYYSKEQGFIREAPRRYIGVFSIKGNEKIYILKLGKNNKVLNWVRTISDFEYYNNEVYIKSSTGYPGLTVNVSKKTSSISLYTNKYGKIGNIDNYLALLFKHQSYGTRIPLPLEYKHLVDLNPKHILNTYNTIKWFRGKKLPDEAKLIINKYRKGVCNSLEDVANRTYHLAHNHLKLK